MIESPLLGKMTGYISGRWTDNEHGNTFDVYNPATGKVIAKVASMSESEVKAAIDAGKSALQLTTPYSIETRRKWLEDIDRKSTRLNSSHVRISYAVFCLKKKK